MLSFKTLEKGSCRALGNDSDFQRRTEMENSVRRYNLKTEEVRQHGKGLGTTKSCAVTSFSPRGSEMTEPELSFMKPVSVPQTSLSFEIKSCVLCVYAAI